MNSGPDPLFQVETYKNGKDMVFFKVAEPFGGLSNMAPYRVRVNGVLIPTSEALYQACRFPHLPAVQQEIIDEKSPMGAKMKAKHHKKNSRTDWDDVKVEIMRWALRVKLSLHITDFGNLLLSTGSKRIVEQSRKDPFWGAKCVNEHLEGQNVLGKLLVELREELKAKGAPNMRRVEPLDIANFLLLDSPIRAVGHQHSKPAAKEPCTV